MSAPYLDIDDLGVRFADQTGHSARSAAPYILRHITISIKRNETFCLLGESGSGKTTLIRALLGLISFQEGHIVLDGQQIKGQGRPIYRRFPNRMQLVFQDPSTSLNPFRTLGKSMQEPLQAQGIKQGERLRIVNRLAEQMGLPAEVLEHRPGSVSGGQCQRACIGRALAAKPDMLFLDEPLAALDTLTRKKVAKLLMRVREQYRMTFFLVTHNLSFAARISSRVAVMYLGRIVEQAPTEQFFQRPGHPYSQALLSSSLDPALWNRERIVLKGDMSSEKPTFGCIFYPRCFRRTARCATEAPSKHLLAEGHVVCCHFPVDRSSPLLTGNI